MSRPDSTSVLTNIPTFSALAARQMRDLAPRSIERTVRRWSTRRRKYGVASVRGIHVTYSSLSLGRIVAIRGTFQVPTGAVRFLDTGHA